MKNNPNTQRDMHQPDDNPERYQMKIAQTGELLEKFHALQNAINCDEPVTQHVIDGVHLALKNLNVHAGSHEMSLQEFLNGPVMQKNKKIWKNVLGGNFESYCAMTVLTDEIASAFAQSKEPALQLWNVAYITDTQARILAGFGGYEIGFGGLKQLTDEQARALAAFGGKRLCLFGLTHMTDVQARALAGFGGIYLSFDVLEQLTDEQAKALAEFQGEEIHLYGSFEISEKAAEYLAHMKGEIKSNDVVLLKISEAAFRLGLDEK